MAIYVRNNLAVKRLPDLETPDVEWIWCLVKIKQITLIICTVYVPPNPSSSQYPLFLSKLSDSIVLAQAYAPHNILLLGDFNAGNTFLDPRFTNHSPLSPFEFALHDEILACNMQQILTEPTRYSDTRNTANLRDLIITSDVSMVHSSGVLSSFSQIDHLPTFASLTIDTPPTSIHTVELWDFGQTDTDKLTRLLMDTEWDDLLDCDLDQATDNFTNALMSAAKASIPFKAFSTKSNNKPWYNLELKREIRKRDRLFHTAKKTQHHTRLGTMETTKKRNYRDEQETEKLAYTITSEKTCRAQTRSSHIPQHFKTPYRENHHTKYSTTHTQ